MVFDCNAAISVYLRHYHKYGSTAINRESTPGLYLVRNGYRNMFLIGLLRSARYFRRYANRLLVRLCILPQVFASGSADKTVSVWDLRKKNGAMLSLQAHEEDVNVISWNRNVTYLLASGSDDGSFKIWDLRAFGSGEPVAQFRWHKVRFSALCPEVCTSVSVRECVGFCCDCIWPSITNQGYLCRQKLALCIASGCALSQEDCDTFAAQRW